MHDTPTMIGLDEALDIVLRQVTPGPTEDVLLADALGRTLASPVRTDLDDPPFDRSVMDGYAVRAEDVRGAPVSLRVAGEVAAGTVWSEVLEQGEAVRINTGAPIPDGADAVVRVEDTEFDAERQTVQIKTAVPPGHFITRRGAHVAAGDVVLQAGSLMTPGAVGVAAAAGANEVRVSKRPRVALVSTGNELVDITATPRSGQIRNSNLHLLAALVQSAGGEAVSCGVARDDVDELKERITRGLECDVLCLTGGISMGTADLVPDALTACGVAFRFRKMAIKPGRPVIFGVGPNGTLVFALPGNPVSAFVCFELLVREALAHRVWRSDNGKRRTRARCGAPLAATSNRRTFIPAVAEVDDDGCWRVTPVRWGGSGDVFGLARANALIDRPAGAPASKEGEEVYLVLFP